MTTSRFRLALALSESVSPAAIGDPARPVRCSESRGTPNIVIELCNPKLTVSE